VTPMSLLVSSEKLDQVTIVQEESLDQQIPVRVVRSLVGGGLLNNTLAQYSSMSISYQIVSR